MKLRVTDQDGELHEVTAAPGHSVMEIIRAAGLDIAALCGGCCICASCHVFVDDAWLHRLPAPDEDENATLELAMELGPNSRLACRLTMASELDGLELALAPGTRL